jgi:amidase
MLLIGRYASTFVRRVAVTLRLYRFEYAHQPRSVFPQSAPYTPRRLFGPAVVLGCALAFPSKAQVEQRTAAALARIEAIDRAGPSLKSILAINPEAAADARVLDKAIQRGPLHGMIVVLKDNIDANGMATTAGSLAMVGNVAGKDATLTARLRAAGAVILGKANLSEWANFRSTRSISGWSAVGGQTLNPHALDRTACGSSTGSAVAVAAGIADAAIGTETDGSITCPAAANGVVGLKPSLGLVPRGGIVPLSPEQDAPGPIARSVRAAAAVLTVTAGYDPAEAATAEADEHKADYVAGLDADALKGARIGVVRGFTTRSPGLDAVFEQALADLRAQGAMLVEIATPDPLQRSVLGAAEGFSLRVEFKAAINAYLHEAPAAVKTRSLGDLIAFNAATPAETLLFGQEIFTEALSAGDAGADDHAAARAFALRRAGARGLDVMFANAKVEAIVAPTGGPAEKLGSDAYAGSPSTMPAVAGYPHLTVPMGAVGGLPVGLSFIGPKWSDGRILALGYAYEQASQRRVEPTFRATVD